MTYVHLPDNIEWLYRPALRQMCKMESLFDGTLNLEQIAEANDVLDVQDENEWRLRKAMEDDHKK